MSKASVLLLLLVVGGAGAEHSGVRVATCTDFSDCTADLQAALDSCAAVVKVPALPGGRPWIVTPIHVGCDGQTIDFDGAVVLQAKRGQFHEHQNGMRLFNVQNVTGVSVLGNGGATFRMWRVDYANPKLYNHSEGRHGVGLFGSRNVVLDGLTVTETGGDGVCVNAVRFFCHPFLGQTGHQLS
jgi:hypothetical protein